MGARTWLFDAGEGCQRQMQHTNISPAKIEKVFITHLHGDHCFGLPGLMCTIGASISDLVKSDKNWSGLHIYGPRGIRRYLDTVLRVSYSNAAVKHVIHELLTRDDSMPMLKGVDYVANTDGLWPQIFNDSDFSVSAGPIYHTTPCIGYAVQEHPLPGSLLQDVLIKEYGLKPGPMYKDLKMGKSVTAPDGRIIDHDKVMTLPRPGRKIVYLGDTHDPSPILPLCHEPDVLVHEATLIDADDETSEEESVVLLDAKVPQVKPLFRACRKVAMERGHSTARMAGQVAKTINAGTLILNHFSSRYVDEKLLPAGETVKDGDVTLDMLRVQAQDVLGADSTSRVLISRDFWTHEVPRRPIPVRELK